MDRRANLPKRAAEQLSTRSDLLFKKPESKALAKAGVEGSRLVAAFKEELEAETDAFMLGASLESRGASDGEARARAVSEDLAKVIEETKHREARTRRAVKAETEVAAELLEVPEHLLTAESYAEFHLGSKPFRLGAEPTGAPDLPEIANGASAAGVLSRFARRAEDPPLTVKETTHLLEVTEDPSSTAVIEHCGSAVLEQPAIRTVNGNCVKWTGKGLRQARLDSAEVADEEIHFLDAIRATNSPPFLRPTALAAFATAVASRDRQPPSNRKTVLASLVCGVPLEIESKPTVGSLSSDSAISILSNAIRFKKGGPAAAAFAEVAYEYTRIQVVRRKPETPSTAPTTTPAIDVGRVRWCNSTHTLAWHVPITAADPDQVGGPDLAWTTDPPAAAAVRTAHHQRLSLSDDWHGRLVVVPGSPKLWIVTPEGTWWDPEVDFDSIVKARLGHLEKWWAAHRKLNEIAPGAIKSMEKVERSKPEAAKPRQTGKKAKRQVQKRSEDFRGLDKETVRKAADRYSYRDDSGPVRAGSKAARRGNYTRDELLEVTGWKSNRTQALVERNSEAAIERATAIALDPKKTEKERIEALTELSGVGYPVASAILHFADPDRYPIIDFRALESLDMKDPEGRYTTEFWLNYLDTTRKGSEILGVSMRVLDKALWQLSKESGD